MRAWSAVAMFIMVFLCTGCTGGANSQEAPEPPDAVTADPQHYAVEFENDVVRVLRIRYGPGEASVMHRHPANCAIFLTDATSTFELPDGEVADASGPAGLVGCGDAEVHLPTNTGGEPFEVVVVELKGRETFAQ